MKTKNLMNDIDIRALRLNKCLAKVLKGFKPPENITVSEWADKYRVLSGNAEPGPWRTARTPYLKEPMDSFNDPMVNRIIVVACSQVGKSELELNIIGYVIDVEPDTIVFLQPTVNNAKKFSKLRINQLIRDCKKLKNKIRADKSKDSNNTVLEKSFPGGMLIMVGTNAPGDLASTPARIVLADERDRHARSAGKEGDPFQLARARQTTFKKRYKSVEVSSPTVVGDSRIADSFYEGTQEYWCHQCPECKNWHVIEFKDIRFDYEEIKNSNTKEPTYKVDLKGWACPSCGIISSEYEMKKQPQKWVAKNPDAYKDGVRSFWIKGFANTWADWSEICLKFLQCKKDPYKLQVFMNTVLGELWEDRGDIETEDVYLSRREEYSADLPDGVLCLTCGVDTQDDRLEYEVVGHGRYKEDWGIHKGFILGRPDDPETWKQLDDVIDRVYYFQNGKGLKIQLTFVDSGGHYTKDVYAECWKRQHKRVFPIKGKGGEYRYTGVPSKLKIQVGNTIQTCHLFTIGVDSGKSQIMNKLRVQEIGPSYSHFPLNSELGYNEQFFNGLLSEHLVWENSSWRWKKIPGHERNEPLDCRNYANAAVETLNPNWDAIERRLNDVQENIQIKSAKKKHTNKYLDRYSTDW